MNDYAECPLFLVHAALDRGACAKRNAANVALPANWRRRLQKKRPWVRRVHTPGNDLSLRRKTEEKLKAINEATRRSSRRAASPSPWRHAAINRGYALVCALIAIFVLLRRPTPGGLVIAVLFMVAFALFAEVE